VNVTPSAANKWRVLSRILKVMGAAGFLATFALLLFLTGYYSAKRPHSPQPELGWTVPLTWTHPTSYGTAREEGRLDWLHWWGLPCFGLIALGEAIKIYILNDYSGIPDRKRPLSPP